MRITWAQVNIAIIALLLYKTLSHFFVGCVGTSQKDWYFVLCSHNFDISTPIWSSISIRWANPWTYCPENIVDPFPKWGPCNFFSVLIIWLDGMGFRNSENRKFQGPYRSTPDCTQTPPGIFGPEIKAPGNQTSVSHSSLASVVFTHIASLQDWSFFA